jgi:hypothetical protein
MPGDQPSSARHTPAAAPQCAIAAIGTRCGYARRDAEHPNGDRIETGQAPTKDSLPALLDLYGVDDPARREQLMEMALGWAAQRLVGLLREFAAC